MSLDPKEIKETSAKEPKEAKIVKETPVKETAVKEPVAKPKRTCSQKQLEALAAGRAKNSRFKPKPSAAA